MRAFSSRTQRRFALSVRHREPVDCNLARWFALLEDNTQDRRPSDTGTICKKNYHEFPCHIGDGFMRNDINRRQKDSCAATIEHAVELMRTHGASYASKYLKNQGVADETIARVLSDNPSMRRALPLSGESQSSWFKEEDEPRQPSIRPLSYKTRGKLTHDS
jgi:hypothetical protein